MHDNQEGNIYKKAGAFLGGMAVGAAVMYMADPEGGGRRRAVARDKAARALHKSQDFLGKAGRDLRNRAEGFAAEARTRFLHHEASDDVLYERVRSKLGRYTSHPRSIEVGVEQGHVTLHGPVISSEVPMMMNALCRIPGVESVDDRMEHHDVADIPDLQGGYPPSGEPAEWAQSTWTPALKLITAAAVGVGILAAMSFRGHGEMAEPEMEPSSP